MELKQMLKDYGIEDNTFLSVQVEQAILNILDIEDIDEGQHEEIWKLLELYREHIERG